MIVCFVPGRGGGDGDAVSDSVESCSRGAGLAVFDFLPPITPSFTFLLEGVLWLGSLEGSGEFVFSLLGIGGFLPPMIPILEIGFPGVSFLVLVAVLAASGSDSVVVSVDADDNCVEAFGGR